MYKIATEKFEGPLDLLLQLIEKEKFDICELSLAKITDSYLKEINNLNCSGDEMAEFVLIAAKLLYIKSKEILPAAANEEEEAEIADLEARLAEYQRYKLAAEKLEEVLANNNRGFNRRAKNDQIISFLPPKDLNAHTLYAIFEEVISQTEETEQETETIQPIKITVEQKRESIKLAIKNHGKVSFRDVLKNSKSKIEVIVTFLAILEMIKQNEILVNQDKNFADFLISGVK